MPMQVMKTPGTLINPTVPPVDPILNAGSVLLFEPGHPVNPVSGVPAHGAQFPNLAAVPAAALAGTSNIALSRLTQWTSTEGTVSRTPKGGWLVVPALSGATPDRYEQIAMQAALTAYIGSRLGDLWGLTWWGAVTRPPQSGAGTRPIANVRTAAGPELSIDYTETGTFGGNPTMGSGRRALGTFTPRRAVIAGTGSAATGTIQNLLQSIGPVGNPSNGKGFALLTYRIYLENLTVSGRTPAQLDAADGAVFNDAMANRYAGDSY